MKVIKGRFDLVKFFFLPFTLLSIFLFFYPPNWISFIYQIHWLFLLGIIICLIRFGKITLGQKNAHDVIWLWLLKLFLIQLLLNVFLWGITHFVNYDLPVSVPANTHIHLFKLVFNTGFFPWGITLLTAVILGYVVYSQNKPALFSSVYSPCFKNSQYDSVGIAVDSYMRLLCMMCMVFVIVFFSLAVLKLLSQSFNVNFNPGLYFSLVVLNTFLIFLVSNKFWNKAVRFAIFHLQPTVMIFLFALLISSIVLFQPFIVAAMQQIRLPDQLMFSVNKDHWITDITIMLDCIGMIFAVLSGTLIAIISQGRSVRSIVWYSFLLNILSWVIILFFEFITENRMNLRGTWIILVCSLIYLQLLNRPAIYYLIRANLPTFEIVKPRSTLLFIRTLLSSSTFLFSLYIALGVYIFSFITVLSLLPPIFLVCIGVICFLKEVLKIGEN